jgi:hypothetical protein
MKFLVTLLSAAALLASGISASPLGERGMIKARAPTKDYDIDGAIVSWMGERHTRSMIKSVCSTSGGWEVWAQVELEAKFKDTFGISVDIREQSKVFNNRKIADFVLPETDQLKGMIIELKCENRGAQSGKAMKAPVEKDQLKKQDVKPEYDHYTFVALAMAFTPEADKVLKKIGMQPIPSASQAVPGKGTMKVYKEKIRFADLDQGMKDFMGAFSGLSLTDSESDSDKPKKPAASASGAGTTKKPAASASGAGTTKKPAASASGAGTTKKPAAPGTGKKPA